MNSKFFEHQKIYITPFNVLASQVYDDLLENVTNFTFLGYIDKYKSINLFI